MKFNHPSEREFASLLDAYEIKWEYEPTTFGLIYREDGQLALAFSPDFYLPEFDLYIELTTMRQKLTTIKNKKMRLMRELYPNIKVKLFNKKDMEMLARKFGLCYD